MKRVLLVALLLTGCQGDTTVLNNIFSNNPTGTSSPDPGAQCASLVSGVQTELSGTTVEGGKFKVGEPIFVKTLVFPSTLPAQCFSGAKPTVSTTEQTCKREGVESFDRTTVLVTGTPRCTVTSCFAGKCASEGVDTVS